MERRRRIGTVAIVLATSVAAATAATANAAPRAAATWTAEPVCAPATSRHAACSAMRLVATPGDGHARTNARALTAGPAGGYTPANLAKAYNANVNAPAAANQTVAIVDAFNDPNISSDLDTFDAQYGITPETATSFRVVNQAGDPSPLPANNAAWAGEESVDVDVVRGLCHLCPIVLVEASSNGSADLAASVNTAVALGATIVSNAYGVTEGGMSADQIASYDHKKVAILATTGDDGWYDWDRYNEPGGFSSNAPNEPASLDTVVAVGGTSLYLNPDGTRQSEQVWNDNGPYDIYGFNLDAALGASGGGCSTLETPKGWQRKVAGYNLLGCGDKRSTGDIAAVGDPFTGFDVYDSFQSSGWLTFGGNSVATNVIAALWALAGGPGNVAYPSLSLYGHFTSDPSSLHDVTLGGNGLCGTATATTCAESSGGNPNTLGGGLLDCEFAPTGTTILKHRFQCVARPGYDGPTGVGTPNGVGAFTPMAPTAGFTAPGTITHGVSASFHASTATDPFPGGTLTKYVWTWGDGTPNTTTTVPTANHTFASAGASTAVKLTVTDNYGRTDSDTKSITVG